VSEAFLREAGSDSLSGGLEHVQELRARAESRLREHRLLVHGAPRGTWHRVTLRGRKLQRMLVPPRAFGPFQNDASPSGCDGRGAWQGRRERAYPEDTGATEDALHAAPSAAWRHKASF
jgi:hypothetical protein